MFPPFHIYLLSLLRTHIRPFLSPLCLPLRPFLPPPTRVPVFLMLPLDTALPSPTIPLHTLISSLKHLKSQGLSGIMVDIWWGLCEPNPQTYDFSAYKQLFLELKKLGLNVQATMSFHSCGGNVGDSVNIPLPSWVVNVGDQMGLWFMDQQGRQTKEYLTFAVDEQIILPAKHGNKRSPLQAYQAFVAEFEKVVREWGCWEETVVEVQVGMGPCGELRYPSYRMEADLWAFPGIGQFQCYDQWMRKSWKATFPDDLGLYNHTPNDCMFFKHGYKEEKGRAFLDWYSTEMLNHLERVLETVKVGGQVERSVKIAGIHWWRLHKSRAAETTSGYVESNQNSVYAKIMQIAKRQHVDICFTCLEMTSWQQPWNAKCGPVQLVEEVWKEAKKYGVRVGGENALEGVNGRGYGQIVEMWKRCKAEKGRFTLLRLSNQCEQEEWRRTFGKFVSDMNKIR